MEKSNQSIKKPLKNVPRFILRFFIAYILVLSGFYVAGHLYAKIFLPIFAYEIKFFKPEYEIRSFGIENINGVNEIYYIVKINKLIPNSLGVHRYGKEVKIETVASLLYIPPIIVLTFILAWPGLAIRERIKVTAISGFFLAVIASIDFPIQLICKIEMGFGLASTSGQIRIFVYHFLNNGGRQFLAVLGFFLSIGLISISKYSKTKLDIGRNDSCPCGSGKKYKNCCM